MEESVGAHYALQVAFETLKDRSKTLQHRICVLEEENLKLRKQGNLATEPQSMSETQILKDQVTQLSLQKDQLANKIKMVTTENQELWAKLSRLNQVNESLGSQLNKINDSLVQYKTRNKEGAHTPLIRSKTFTQDQPKVLQHRNLEEENDKICSELEEISLKIISSFAQSKNEIQSLYSDITDTTHPPGNIITESCGFFHDEFDGNVFDDFDTVLDELRHTKEICLQQQTALRILLEKLELKRNFICDSKVQNKPEMIDKSCNTQPVNETVQQAPVVIPKTNTWMLPPSPAEEAAEEAETSLEMICPVCCQNFLGNTDFEQFHRHVEAHFTATDRNSFEIL